MLWLGLITIVALGIFFFFLWQHSSGGRRGSIPTPTKGTQQPRSVARPANTTVKADARGTQAQMLRVPDVNGACEAARHYVGRVLDVATSPKLPLPGCGVVECRCRYERVVNLRRKERREGADRRDEIRFETKIDRRNNPDRRVWNAFWDRLKR